MQADAGSRPVPAWRAWRAWPWRWIAAAAAVGVAATLIAALLLARWLAATTPGPDAIRAAQSAQASVLVAADGTVLARLAEDVQQPVPLARIAPVVVQALIATEDQRFYVHRGIDARRLVGAAWASLWGPVQGGSTITQQLARNLFPEQIGRDRSLLRKARELVVALRLEGMYTKDEILASYLNTAPFLYNVSGIEMAARTWFGKSAAELDTLEAATLVGMLKGAHYYDPARYPERAQKRRNLVLAQLVRTGALDRAGYESLITRPLALQFDRIDTRTGPAPHFVGYARRQLAAWADAHDRDLFRDGLVVETTLEPQLQALAESAVAEQGAALQRVADTEWSRKAMPALANPPAAEAKTPFAWLWQQQPGLLDAALREAPEYRRAVEAVHGDDARALERLKADAALVDRVRIAKTRLEAGFVALEPATGFVRAWVGSRDFARDQFDHVAQAKRQPGSTFKAFVYGAALAAGASPNDTFVDEPVAMALPDGTVWTPGDMGGATGTTMSLREGLAQSKNTITVQVMQRAGLPAIVDFARAAGVREAKLDAVPSLALGTSPVSLLEMAGAYGTLAALGERHAPQVIRRIRDRHGAVIADFAPTDTGAAEPAIPRPVASRLIDMMRDVVLSGTASTLGSRFGVRADIAGKTGTTQNNTDGWFLAMQPGLVAGAWVGFNDQRVRLRSDYWGQGAHSALLVVGDFLKRATKAGLVDAKARFPVERIEPLPTPQPDLPRPDLSPLPGLMDALPAMRDAPAGVEQQASVV